MQTFWRYVRLQLFVFVCGIVGPIFLVIYFALQPEPTIKWMFWAGLVVTTADALIALVLSDGSKPAKSTSKQDSDES